MVDLCRALVEDSLRSSSQCVEAITQEIADLESLIRTKTDLYYFKGGKRSDIALDGQNFFLRTSVEYSNPQLTVEEIQGIIAARMLECCGNYAHKSGLQKDKGQSCQALHGKSIRALAQAELEL